MLASHMLSPWRQVDVLFERQGALIICPMSSLTFFILTNPCLLLSILLTILNLFAWERLCSMR